MRRLRLKVRSLTIRFMVILLLLVAMQQRAQAVDYYSSGSGEFSTIFPLAGLASGDRLYIQNGHTLTVNGINDYSSVQNIQIIIINGGALQLNDVLGVLHLGNGSNVIVKSGGQVIATGILGGLTTAITVAGGGVIPPAYSPLFGDSNPLNGPASVTASGTVILNQLYSIASTEWNTPGTWSTSSGGPSCNCIPGPNDLVIIESHRVRINNSSMCGGLIIKQGGQLLWANYDTLYIKNSGSITVDSLATLDMSLIGVIHIENSSTTSITNAGTMRSIQINYINNNTSVHITNTGNFSTSPSGKLYATTNATITNGFNGNLTIDELDGNSTNFVINNNGVIYIQKLSNVNNSTIINNKNQGTLYLGNGPITDIQLFCDIDGPNTTVIGGANQEIIVPQDSYWHLELVMNSDKNTIGDFNIKGNLTFILDYYSTPSKINSTHRIVLNGNTQQNISCRNSPYCYFQFYNLTVNNTSGLIPAVLLKGPYIDLRISNNLTLTNGVIATEYSSIYPRVFFEAGSSVTPAGGSANSYIDGKITKAGTSAFTFPTGDGAIWAPIGISAPSTAGTEFTARYFDAGYPDLTTDGTFSHVSASEYWTLSRANSTDAVNVTLHWKDDTRSEISDLADLRVARWDGSQWVSEGQNANSGTISPAGWVESNPVSSFSPFTFASQNGLNALPVTLTYFTGNQEGDMIQLRWQTASEINNDFFTLERSFDAKTFVPIGRVEGKGNTSEKTTYSFTDYPGVSGLVYYRLSQTDFDGTSETFDIISVNYELSATGITAWPNPVTDGRINIALPAPVKGKLSATLYSASGAVVFRQDFFNPEKTFSLELPAGSGRGLYLLQLDTQGSSTRIKLLVK